MGNQLLLLLLDSESFVCWFSLQFFLFLVKIEDVNDHSPEFDQTSYAVSVLPDESFGKVIVSVSATDMDDGTNGRIIYSLLDSQEAKV